MKPGSQSRFALPLGFALVLSQMGCERSEFVNDRGQVPDSTAVIDGDRPMWTNRLRIRMGWIPTLGRDPAKTSAESTAVIHAGLDSSANRMELLSTLSLIRLHGEMGWVCRGCGYVLNDPMTRIGIDSLGDEMILQARTVDDDLVAWGTLEISTRRSFRFFIDSGFQRRSDSASIAFRERIRRTGGDYVRRQHSRENQPNARTSVLPETELMGQFSHFSTRVVDLDLEDYLDRLDTISTDSVRIAELVRNSETRRIMPEELDVLGLAANIGVTSKSCYRRISNGDISFRTRRTGSWRVTSAWNPQGKPVAWNALDTASGFQYPIWFHLDRQACVEQTDSVASRPSLFRRIFHLQ